MKLDHVEFEHLYLESLQRIKNDYEGGNIEPAVLLNEFLKSTDHYLQNLTFLLDTELISDISDLFASLREELSAAALGKKIKTHENALAIGQFIEGLIFFGMPRKPAMEAVAKYLNIGYSTARSHNEAYREKYNTSARQKQFDTKYFMSPYVKTIKAIIESGTFPQGHPKAQKAFKAMSLLFLKEHDAIRKKIYQDLRETAENR